MRATNALTSHIQECNTATPNSASNTLFTERLPEEHYDDGSAMNDYNKNSSIAILKKSLANHTAHNFNKHDL